MVFTEPASDNCGQFTSINYFIIETAVHDVRPVWRLLYDRLKTADWRRRRLAPRFRQPAEVSCNCHLLRTTSLVVSHINLPDVIYSSCISLNEYFNNGKCCLSQLYRQSSLFLWYQWMGYQEPGGERHAYLSVTVAEELALNIEDVRGTANAPITMKHKVVVKTETQ